MTRILRFAALAALAAGLLLGEEFFPMAVWYGGGKARAPMLEPDARAKKEIWRRDIRQIKALGFNTIRCWMDWASGEPAEEQYRFDTLDVLLELAEEEGLKVLLQVYMDSAPAWVGRKYPDSLFVSSNGQAVMPESSPGYCRDHPGVRAADVAFYRALAERARKSPAFAGWDLWSEPHVINWATPTYISNPEFCFCPNTLKRFRGWLRQKYGTLEALNKAWYRGYVSWDEVQPNRMSTILSYTDYIDWKAFIADKLAEDLHERYTAVKTAAPEAVATSHAAGVGLFSSPHWWEGQSDDWQMAQQVDYYGTSFYPKHSAAVDRDPEWRAALLDFTRSFGYAGKGRGFFIGELQAGFGTIALSVSQTVTPADLRIWMWSTLARGAKGVCVYAYYPMSSGYESGGFGLINLDGTVTERAKAAGAVARAVDRNQKLFLNARPVKAQAAIIYNPLSHFVGGRQRAAVYGGPQGEAAGIERDSLLGIYRALFSTNVPLDYVHIDQLTPETAAQYKLIYLPYPLMLPAKAGAVLRAYVENGGALVSEARAGWNDERGWASDIIPAFGLHEVFGARELHIRTAPAKSFMVTWTGGTAPGQAKGERVPGRLFEETLEPVRPNAKAVATGPQGTVAVASTYGKGKTLLLGTFLSAAFETTRDPGLRRFFTGLLDWAGVAAPVQAAGGAEVRMLESNGDLLVFAFNHKNAAADVSLRVRGKWRAADLVSGEPVDAARGIGQAAAGLTPCPEENVAAAGACAGTSITKRIAAQDVWVVRLSPAK